MLHGTFYSHVTSLTLTSRLAFRINVKGRGPPSSNKCKIWHGAGLSSTKTSEQNTQSTMQVTWMNPQRQRKYKTLLWDSLLLTLYDEFWHHPPFKKNYHCTLTSPFTQIYIQFCTSNAHARHQCSMWQNVPSRLLSWVIASILAWHYLTSQWRWHLTLCMQNVTTWFYCVDFNLCYV